MKTIILLAIVLLTNLVVGQEIICTKEIAKIKTIDTSGTAAFENQKGMLKIPTEAYLSIDTTSQAQKDNTKLEIKAAFRIICKQKTKAIAVSQGVVRGIAHIENKWLVIIRHGEYLSVYSNLETVNVKELQTLSTGDIIGQLATTNHETYLNFQLWKGNKRISPYAWFLYKS